MPTVITTMTTCTARTKAHWSTTTASKMAESSVADGRTEDSSVIPAKTGIQPSSQDSFLSGLDPGLCRGNEPWTASAAFDAVAQQKLMAWLSPAFPVGSYTYSHGLEWAIEDGSVTTPEALQTWLATILHHGAGRTDAIVFCHASRARGAALREIAELAAAFQPSRERHLETTAQGNAFLQAVMAAWPNGALEEASAALLGMAVPYPVAVAAAAAAHDIPLAPALTAMLTAFVANIVSAGVRAIPIGQSAGQKTIAALAPAVVEVARGAQFVSLDDLGGATLRADIASMKHETQYTRLFRS
jgi:urease accessory protein